MIYKMQGVNGQTNPSSEQPKKKDLFMNSKKTIALALSFGLLTTNTMPVFAIHDVFKKHDKKVIKSQVTEYKFNDVNLQWWKNYNDDLLEGYIIKAINSNYDLKVATLKVEEARQNIKLQFSKELPSASIGFAPATIKMPESMIKPGQDSTSSSLGWPALISYEIDIFAKNHDKTKSVKKQYEASKFNEKAAYIAVASQVGATYFNIVKLDKLIAIQEDIIKNRKQIADLMNVRNREGITSTADATRAQKSYMLAVVDLSDLQKARSILLNSLAVLIGETPNNVEELKRISYDEIAYKMSIPNEIPSDIIMQRPDYMAAEKMVEKAGIDVRVAKKEFLPSLNIMGLLFFSSSALSSSFNWSNALALLGGGAMLPIFTGGARVANLRLSKNKYEQIMQNYYKTNLVAIQEVNDNLSNLKLDDDKYKKNVDSYNMQKEDYNYMDLRYKQGVISNLDLIQQKETLLVMNKMVVSSKTDCYIDQIGLYKAVGGKL